MTKKWSSNRLGVLQDYARLDRHITISTDIVTTRLNWPRNNSVKMCLSFAILAKGSLTISLQSTRFRIPANGPNRHINRHTDIATYRLNQPIQSGLIQWKWKDLISGSFYAYSSPGPVHSMYPSVHNHSAGTEQIFTKLTIAGKV